jgi:anthranilate synthase component 2
VNLLLLDNHDSFTWNLVQALGELGAGVEVVRSDACDLGEALARPPAGVVISPGPGRPERAGASLEAVARCAGAGVPLLGVCLGMQALGVAFGARLVRARRLRHGKTSWIHHTGVGVFRDLASPFEAARYHSLAVDGEALPGCLEVTARSEDGEVMGLRHAALNAEGVQFHPESILTRDGRALLQNFLAACAGTGRA